uniref:Uncharacterized protein n=1 Tax=Meloidogyne enterolobii TaxID=390850 RepID=A0A6V7XMM5_MELEN|nr:unnamed protein product [Meloidogyne enterolobii]
MFNENELIAEKNRIAAIIFALSRWITFRLWVKKDLPKYWEGFFRSKRTKFWFNELYDYIFTFEDIKQFNDKDMPMIKILAGIKAIADGELKIDEGNLKEIDLQLTELIASLTMLRHNQNEKFDKIWRKGQNRRNFKNWATKLLKDELFKEIEIIKDDNGKEKEGENKTEINYFLDRLKEGPERRCRSSFP